MAEKKILKMKCAACGKEDEYEVDDLLEEIFGMQQVLNLATAQKNDVPELESLMMSPAKQFTNLRGKWLRNYSLAMSQEISELIDSTNWKWWRTKVDLYDEQNIKVELIDILHFWVSACQVMGMTATDVYRIYIQKNQINHERQDSGYVVKDDDDCKEVE